jgi:hypothetical protein
MESGAGNNAVATRRVAAVSRKMNTIKNLKENAALPRKTSHSQNVPTAPDVKKRGRPTGLTRAEVRKVVEQMIG